MSCHSCRQRIARYQCAGCKSAIYCGVECQTAHWKSEHQLQCINLKLYGLNQQGKRVLIFDDDDIFGLQANDSENVYQLTWKEVKKLGLKIPKEVKRDDPITVPVTSLALQIIINHVRDRFEESELSNLSIDQLVDLLAGVDYFDYEPLYPIVFSAIADALPNVSIAKADQILTDPRIQFLVPYILFFFGSVYQIIKFRDKLQAANKEEASERFLLYFDEKNANIFGTTPALLAVSFGDVKVVRWLLALPLEYDIQPAGSGRRFMIEACASGHVEVVRLLLDTPNRGIDPATTNNFPIRKAARNGHVEVVRLLLQTPNRGIDPAAADNDAIRIASQFGHVEVVRLLLNTPNRGIDPAARDNEAIRIASQIGHVEVVRILLNTPNRGIDPTALNNWPLISACRHGNVEVVELLLNAPYHDIDPTVEDNEAIRVTTRYGHVAVVRLILQYHKLRGDDRNFQIAFDIVKDTGTPSVFSELIREFS